MNWGQFKGHASHMCLAGTMVASWSLALEVAGSSPFTVICCNLSLNLLNSVKHLGKTSICQLNIFLLLDLRSVSIYSEGGFTAFL